MNVVVDSRIADQIEQFINPKFTVYEVDCNLETVDFDLEALIEKVYARCVDHCAEIFIGKRGICEEISRLGIRTIVIEDIKNGK